MATEINSNSEALAQVVSGLVAAQGIESLVRTMQAETRREFATLRAQLERGNKSDTDKWLDAKAAANYMSVSRSSFDKYRYLTNPKLNGYRLDGKILYKKSDIDDFVRLYAVKLAGRA